MTMSLLSARRSGGDLRYVVHLDTARTIPDPADATRVIPDPAWVLDRTYGAGPQRPSETGAQFAARMTAFEAGARAEMRALAIAELARLAAGAGVALAGEGAAFS